MLHRRVLLLGRRLRLLGGLLGGWGGLLLRGLARARRGLLRPHLGRAHVRGRGGRRRLDRGRGCFARRRLRGGGLLLLRRSGSRRADVVGRRLGLGVRHLRRLLDLSGPAGRAQRLVLDLLQFGLVGAVLALELEVLPDGFVKNAHGLRPVGSLSLSALPCRHGPFSSTVFGARGRVPTCGRSRRARILAPAQARFPEIRTALGAIAQLEERLDRTQEVAGSSPASSTREVTAEGPPESPGHQVFSPNSIELALPPLWVAA